MKQNDIQSYAVKWASKIPFNQTFPDYQDYFHERPLWYAIGEFKDTNGYSSVLAPIGLHLVYRILIWPFCLIEWAIGFFRYPGQNWPTLP